MQFGAERIAAKRESMVPGDRAPYGVDRVSDGRSPGDVDRVAAKRESMVSDDRCALAVAPPLGALRVAATRAAAPATRNAADPYEDPLAEMEREMNSAFAIRAAEAARVKAAKKAASKAEPKAVPKPKAASKAQKIRDAAKEAFRASPPTVPTRITYKRPAAAPPGRSTRARMTTSRPSCPCVVPGGHVDTVWYNKSKITASHSKSGWRVFTDLTVSNPVDKLVRWGDNIQAAFETSLDIIDRVHGAP